MSQELVLTDQPSVRLINLHSAANAWPPNCEELTAQEIFENQSQGRLQYVIVRNGGKDGQVKSYPPASGKPQELEGSVPLEIEGLKEAVWRHSPYSWGSIPGSFYKAASMKTKSLPGYATAFSKPFMAFVK
eukprot:g31960.t1